MRPPSEHALLPTAPRPARALGQRLRALHLEPPLIVLALPRGGVPVGAAVAQALQAPLDLLLVRKIGAPWQRELALAAVVEGDPPEIVVDEEVQRGMGTHTRIHRSAGAGAVARDRAAAPGLPERPAGRCRSKAAR